MHDANGDALAISWLPPGTKLNVAHFEAFSAVRDDPRAGLFLSPATRSPSDGQWMLPLVRRLETPTGQFAGAVGARGRIDYFQQFYRDIRLERGNEGYARAPERDAGRALSPGRGGARAALPAARDDTGEREPRDSPDRCER